MPDLSILIEIADFYKVDIREIMDGERKDKTMNKETKEVLEKVCEYSEDEKKNLKKKLLNMSLATLIIFVFYLLLELTNGFGFIPEKPCQNFKELTLLVVAICLILNSLYLSRIFNKAK